MKKTPRTAADAPTLQERKQQLVRDAIWDAAMELFAAKGFDETTVDEIAQMAGVSRRSFFRYFSSKNDLMAQGIVAYGNSLAEAIAACPRSFSLADVLRETVLRVARQSAAHTRTRTVMQVAARYPAAREAQMARMSELQDKVAEAFALRCGARPKDALTSSVLAGLTLSLLGVTFRTWFERGEADIAATAERVFQTLERLVRVRPLDDNLRQWR